MDTQQTSFYTVGQVAGLLKINEATVRELIRTGKLEAFTVGSRYRISADALDSYIKASTTKVAS
jgi:excisionase family DNA binding protein